MANHIRELRSGDTDTLAPGRCIFSQPASSDSISSPSGSDLIQKYGIPEFSFSVDIARTTAIPGSRNIT